MSPRVQDQLLYGSAIAVIAFCGVQIGDQAGLSPLLMPGLFLGMGLLVAAMTSDLRRRLRRLEDEREAPKSP